MFASAAPGNEDARAGMWPLAARFWAPEHAQRIDCPARIGIFLVLPHDLDRGAIVDRRERWYRGAIFDLFTRLFDWVPQQPGGEVGPFKAQQYLRLGKGVERKIRATRRDEGDRNVRPAAQLLLQERAQWLGAARFFRGLRKNIFVEKALFG